MTTPAPNPALRAAALLQPAPQPPLTTRDERWLRIVRAGAGCVVAGVVTTAIVAYFGNERFSEQALRRLAAARDPAVRSIFLFYALAPAAWLLGAVGLWLAASPRTLRLDRRERWSARRVVRLTSLLFGVASLLSAGAGLLFYQAQMAGAPSAVYSAITWSVASAIELAIQWSVAPLFIAATLHARSLARLLDLRRLDGALGAALIIVPLAYLLHLILLDAIDIGADSWLVIVPPGVTNALAWAFPVGFALLQLAAAATIGWSARARLDALPADPTPETSTPLPPPARCPGCDYDLTSLQHAAACPECGAPVAAMRITDEAADAMPHGAPSRFARRFAVDLILFELIARTFLKLPLALAETGLIENGAQGGYIESAAYNFFPLLGLAGWWLVLGDPGAARAPDRAGATRRLARFGVMTQATALVAIGSCHVLDIAPGYEFGVALVAIHLCGLALWWWPAMGRLALIGSLLDDRRLERAAIAAFWLAPACFFGVITQGSLWDGVLFDSASVISGWLTFIIDTGIVRNRFAWAAGYIPELAVFLVGAALYLRVLLALRRAHSAAP